MTRAIVLGLFRGLETLFWLAMFLAFICVYRQWIVSEPVPFSEMPQDSILALLFWAFGMTVCHPAGYFYALAAGMVSPVCRFLEARQRVPVLLLSLAVSVVVSLLVRAYLPREAASGFVGFCGALTFCVLSKLILPHMDDAHQRALRVLAGQQEGDYESMKALAERLRKK